MEKQEQTKSSGLTRGGLRIWGYLFVVAGIIGRSIFQKELLGIGQVSGQQLLELMQSSDTAMIYATVALILQAIETCAVPIFAVLLLEGFLHTGSFKHYIRRVVIVALLSEIPYNLAVSGKVLDTATRNPALGLVVALILLYLYKYLSEKTMQNRIIKVLVAIAALLWVSMLKIDFGVGMVLVTCILWAFRKNPLYRNIAGATASIVCTMASPFFLASPMGFLVVHFYNGEKGSDFRVANYLAYPVLLLVIGLIAMFAI